MMEALTLALIGSINAYIISKIDKLDVKVDSLHAEVSVLISKSEGTNKG